MTGKPSGYKNQPTHWPTAPFVLIKLSQALCCLVVLLIMAFFDYNLKKDNYPIPWQFAFLTAIVRSKFHTIPSNPRPQDLYRLILFLNRELSLF